MRTYLLGVDSHEIPKVVPAHKELCGFFKFLQVYSLTGQYPSPCIIEEIDGISIDIQPSTLDYNHFVEICATYGRSAAVEPRVDSLPDLINLNLLLICDHVVIEPLP